MLLRIAGNVAYALKVLAESIEEWRTEKKRKANEARRADLLADHAGEWMRKFNEQQTGTAPKTPAGKQPGE